MKLLPLRRFAFTASLMTLLAAADAHAGTFKRIAIDGSFGDWAGVPVSYNDSSETTAGADFRQVSIANDDQYLYLRFTLYAADTPFTSRNNLFIDADDNAGTGFHPLGLAGFGSELLIQSGTGYQEKNGGFNEGAINGLDWAASPNGSGTDFELRISRSATYAGDGLPVFARDTIAVLLESENTSFVAVDLAPDSGERLPYSFATPPEPFIGRRELVSLTTSTWRANASGDDLGTAWAEPGYDDSQAGWNSGTGLFGFSSAPGVYPAPIATPLASGRTTHYFRSRFEWTNDPAGVVLVASNYLSDGAVVYLNGIEARRLRLPAGAVAFNTPATGGPAVKGTAELVGLQASSLLVGENVIAVEAHQTAGDNLDLVFGLSLTAASQFPVVFTDASLPADRTVVAGQSTTFAAEFVGSGPLTYQWYKDTQPLQNATGPVLTIDPVLAADAGAYQLKVSNPVSTEVASRVALLNVISTPVTITDSTQPADQTVVEGSSVRFTVAAAGSAPLSYQWFKGLVAIPDATAASHTIPIVSLGDGGDYRVVVSNPLPSSVTSRSARLTVSSDRTRPSIVRVIASVDRVVITFSEPVDEASAGLAANFAISGGLNVTGAARSSGNPAEVVLTTAAQSFGVLRCVTVNGVRDLFNNVILPDSSAPFVSTILIDGSFGDWAGVPLAVADAVDLPTASDYQNIFVTNDATHLFIRATLHAPSDLGIFYNNIFIDGDNNAGTGFSFRVGSEMLIQGGGGYQQKNGGFNEGGINGLDWAISPAGVGTDFEFRIARGATFASDGLPVFTSPVIGLVFDAENTSFQTVDTAPDSGGIIYTLFDAPSTALGKLRFETSAFGELIIHWSGPGALQARPSLTSGQWETVWDLPSPYNLGEPAGQQFYRLTVPCP
jgi:hypothetical protein